MIGRKIEHKIKGINFKREIFYQLNPEVKIKKSGKNGIVHFLV